MEKWLRKFFGWHGFLYIDQGFASHLGWGFAVPLLGYLFFGFWGCIILGTIWITYAFYREFVEEEYEPTAWSDIVSRCASTVIVLATVLIKRFL